MLDCLSKFPDLMSVVTAQNLRLGNVFCHSSLSS